MPRALLRRILPNSAALRESRALRWLGPLLERPSLWRFDRRGVALGLTLGVFFGLLVPLGQVLVAGVAAVALRANLAAAVAATFISNPLTTPGILVAGYAVGTRVLGVPLLPRAAPAEAGLLERLADMGEPLLLGLLIVASAGAALVYGGVLVAWRVSAWARLKRQRSAQGAAR